MTAVRFREAVTNDITTPIVGYRNAHYGHGVRAPAHSTTAPMAGPLPLPMPLDRLPGFVAVADYAVSPMASSALPPLDFAYDMWLTTNTSAIIDNNPRAVKSLRRSRSFVRMKSGAEWAGGIGGVMSRPIPPRRETEASPPRPPGTILSKSG